MDAMDYINQGSEVRNVIKNKKTRKGICLYIPTEFLDVIDKELNKKIGLSRNFWILTAMAEKLERDNVGTVNNT